jgi:phospholipid N-methyltransferase
MTVKFWETWMGNPGAVAAVATPASSAVALRMVLVNILVVVLVGVVVVGRGGVLCCAVRAVVA